MSDAATATPGEPTPEPAQQTQAQQQPAQATAQPTQQARTDSEPDWLGPRLKQAQESAQRKLLNELGFPDLEAAKDQIQKAKQIEEASLTEQERVAKRVAELEPQAQRATVLEKRYAALIEEQFAALPEAQRSAIDAVANGDPEKRHEYMSVFRAAGVVDAPASPETGPALNNGEPAAGAAPDATTKPAPVTTTPPGSPPTPAQPRNRWEEYQALTNPMQAAIFYRANKREIEASRPTQ